MARAAEGETTDQQAVPEEEIVPLVVAEAEQVAIEAEAAILAAEAGSWRRLRGKRP